MPKRFLDLIAESGTGMKGRIVRIYVLLGLANIFCWAWAIMSFRHYPVLLGTSFLAYSFGLRHAVDADHIAAIDNITRKLMQEKKQPLNVGLFFSLGHSTIVIALSIAIAVTAVSVKSHLPGLETFGGLAGTLVSTGFLLVLAVLNMIVLRSLFQSFRRVKKTGAYNDEDINAILGRRGIFGRIFRGLFRLVAHSWQMYPIGLLFGLGFDTATEVGLLGISAAEASKGLNVWSIMVFPALFTAGMALIDTTDSIFMVGAYGWAFKKPMRKLYYNMIITSISVTVAVVVGGIEALGLLQDRYDLTGPVWNMIAAMNDNFGILGYIIIGIFVLSWAGSVTFYKLRHYDEIKIICD